MASETLLLEVEALRSLGFAVELNEADGVVYLIIDDYPLPPLYNKPKTTLLLRLPTSYPNGNPDMFWTDPDLTCSNGQIPTKGDQVEHYLGRDWRRFSWHPQGWSPGACNLVVYLEFIDRGLQNAGKQ